MPIRNFIARSIWLLLVVLPCGHAMAQTPEEKQAEAHAMDYTRRGDWKNAIIAYRQAIRIWPGQTTLHEGLGKALYASGDYKSAAEELGIATAKPGVTPETYRLLAASEERLDEQGKAKRTIKEAMNRYPEEGGLYEELGDEYAGEQKWESALTAWLDGVEKCPVYAANYRKAADVYFSSGKPFWGVIYGEEYLYLAHDTASDGKVKKSLLDGYRKFFEGLAVSAPANAGHSFQEAVTYIYTTLTPVISDGVTTENLAMIRTRFLMEWFTTYSKTYPFPLFDFQQKMVSTGHFDMDNQWLFGKAESEADYRLWNIFHEGDIARFEEWLPKNRPMMGGTKNYNDGDMKHLFRVKK